MVLLTRDASALFVWRKFLSKADEQGLNCSAFRNEGRELSSDLILDAEQAAWTRWEPQRLYTYVDSGRVRSTNPGFCFICAGWHRCGLTKDRGLVILEKGG